MPAPTTRDTATIATTLTSAPSITSAAFRLKVSQTWLRARCVADDTLRPLFEALGDRGRGRARLGMQELRWIEEGRQP